MTPPSSSQAIGERRYWAFISHSSKDRAMAKWLHKAIETYGLPARLVSHATPSGEPAPQRFFPLFFDRDELPAGPSVGLGLSWALESSSYMIVLCSPNAARSRYVDWEIRQFGALGRGARVFALVIDGAPGSGGATECLPPALCRSQVPLVDLRAGTGGRREAMLRVLARMLGVEEEEILENDRRRRRRMASIVSACALLAALGCAALLATNIALERQRQLAISNAARAEAVAAAERERGAVAAANEALAIALAAEERAEAERQRLKGESEALRAGEEKLRWRLANEEAEEEGIRADIEAERARAATALEAEAKATAEAATARAEQERLIAETAAAKADQEALRGELRAKEAETELARADWERGRAERERQTRRLVEYDADMRHAAALRASGDSAAFQRLMKKHEAPGDPDPRGFEWGYLLRPSRAGLERRFEVPANLPAAAPEDRPSLAYFQGEPLPRSDWRALAVSPDGSRVAAVVAASNACVVWNFAGSAAPVVVAPAFDVGFATGGRDLATLSYDEKGDAFLVVSDPANGVGRRRVALGMAKPVRIACDPARPIVVAANRESIAAWSLRDGSMAWEIRDLAPEAGSRGEPASLAYHPQAGLVAVGWQNGDIDVWETPSGRKKASFETFNYGEVLGLSFNPDGTRLASLGSGRPAPGYRIFLPGWVEVWSFDAEKAVASFHYQLWDSLPQPDRPTFDSGAPDGQFQPVFSGDGAFLYLPGPASISAHDLKSGRLVDALTGHDGMIAALAISDDGHVLAGAGGVGGVIAWRVDAGSRPPPPVASHSGALGALALDASGETLFVLAEDTRGNIGVPLRRNTEMVVAAYKIATGEPVPPESYPPEAAPGGSIARALAAPGRPASDGEAIVVAVSPDSRFIASGGFDRRVRVRDAATGELIASMPGHRREVASLAFSRDGRRLASGSGLATVGDASPGEVIVWDAGTWDACLELAEPGSATYGGLAFSPDGTTLYAAVNPAGGVFGGRIVAWTGAAPSKASARPASGAADASPAIAAPRSGAR